MKSPVSLSKDDCLNVSRPPQPFSRDFRFSLPPSSVPALHVEIIVVDGSVLSSDCLRFQNEPIEFLTTEAMMFHGVPSDFWSSLFLDSNSLIREPR